MTWMLVTTLCVLGQDFSILPGGGEGESGVLEGWLYATPDGQVRFDGPNLEILPVACRTYDIECTLAPSLADSFKPLLSEELPYGSQDRKWALHFLNERIRTGSEAIRDTFGNAPESPLVFMVARVTRHPTRIEQPQDFGLPTAHYEIDGLDVVTAEYVSVDWLHTSSTLLKTLSGIAEASLTAPGEEKREKITALVEEASRLLTAMAKEEARPVLAEALLRLSPEGHETSYRKREWRRKLHIAYADFLDAFRMKPETIPPAVPDTAFTECLKHADSPTELQALLEAELGGFPTSNSSTSWMKNDDEPFEAKKEYYLKSQEEQLAYFAEMRQTASETWGSGPDPDVLAQQLFLDGAVLDARNLEIMLHGQVDEKRQGDPSVFQQNDMIIGIRDHFEQFPVLSVPCTMKEGCLVLRDGVTRPVQERVHDPYDSVAKAGDEERTVFRNEILYRTEDGEIWIEHFYPQVGMFGHSSIAYCFRLAPEVAQQLAPLLSVETDFHEHDLLYPDFYNGWHPRATSLIPPPALTFLTIDARTRCMGLEKSSDRIDILVFEVVSAKLLNVERTHPKWNAAWLDVDKAVYDLVQATLTQPTAQKRQELEAILKRGRQALTDMVRYEDEAPVAELLEAIRCSATCLPVYQTEMRNQWRDMLERHTDTLGISTDIPAPPEVDLSGGVDELILASKTRKKFLQRVKEANDPWLPMAPIYYHTSIVYAGGGGHWDSHACVVAMVSDLRDEDFSAIRESIREQRKRREEWEHSIPEEENVNEKKRAEAALGVRFEEADPDTCRKFMVLNGLVVTEVTDKARQKGIAIGDLMPFYTDYYRIRLIPSAA